MSLNQQQVNDILTKSKQSGLSRDQAKMMLQKADTRMGGMPSSQPDTGKSWGGFFDNVESSGKKMVTDIATAVTNPIDTAKGMYQLGSGVISKFIPGRQKSEDTADAVGKFYKDRYGGVENIKNTLYNDPIGALADVSTVISGVGAGAGLAGKAGTASKLSKVASLTDPLQATVKAVGATTRPLTKFFPKMIENLPKADDLVMRGAGNPAIQKKMIVPAEKIVPKYNLWERTPEAVTEVIKDLNKKRQGAIEGAGSTANLQDLLKPLDDAILSLKNNKFAMKSDTAKGQLNEMMRRRQDLIETFSKPESVDVPSTIDTPKLSVEPSSVEGGGVDPLQRFISEPNTPEITAYNGSEKIVKRVGNIEKLKGENGSFRYITRDKNGKIIGGLQGVRGRGKKILSNIYVDPNVRRQGIGTNLLNQAKKDFPDLKISEDQTELGKAFFSPSPQLGGIDPKEIKKVADNLEKNNPGFGRTNAEAMAKDVIRNRPLSQVGGKVGGEVKKVTPQPFETIKSTNINPKVKLSDYDAFRREAIDPDVPQGAFDQALSQNKAKDAGAKTVRRSMASKVDELAGTKDMGKDLQSLYKLRDVFEGYQTRVKNRQTVNVHKMGGGILGGSLAGAKGAITGFLVEQIVNSPKGLEMMYKVAKGVEKGAFGKKLGKASILSGIEKELAKYNLPNTKEVAKMIYNYGRAGRMTNND